MRKAVWQCRAHLKNLKASAFLVGGRVGLLPPRNSSSHFSTACQVSGFQKHNTECTLRPLTRRWYGHDHGDDTHIPELERLEDWPKLPPGVHDRRELTIHKVNSCVKRHFGGQYTAKPFGSVCYGADTPDSDIDLVIFDATRPRGGEPRHQGERAARIYNVRPLGKALASEGFQVDLTLRDAAVPIVKFRDPETGIKCDVNVNERLGHCNTMLIKEYCTILPILPALILCVKQWAKKQRWMSSMNSYTLAIMFIGVLQHHGVLPNLQRGLRDEYEHTPQYFWARTRIGKMYQSQRCEISWYPPDEDWVPTRTMTFDEALIAWFKYWVEEHSYAETGIDIKRGGVYQRQRPYAGERAEYATQQNFDSEDQLIAWMNESHMDDDLLDLDESLLAEDDEPLTWSMQELCIRDPFIRDKNLTARMFDNQMEQWRSSCRNAFWILTEAHTNAWRRGTEGIASYMADTLLTS